MSAPETTGSDIAQTETAKRALGEVCSAKDLASLPDVYHPDFVDHVNALEYRGHEGARQSVALYKELASDTLELVRQLGVWRLLLLAIRHPRLVLRGG